MSKLIVEMEMPRGCYFCPMAEPHPTYWFCRAFDDLTQIDGCAPMDKRRSWCPIKGELPEQHGDLIDRDELMIELMDRGIEGVQTDDLAEFQQIIMDAKAVIAAERKDDGTTAD